MGAQSRKVSGHGDLVDELIHLQEVAEYWRKRCAVMEGAIHTDITTIPRLIAEAGGNLDKATREGNFSHMTARRYRFDRNSEQHIIVRGVLMTRARKNKAI